MGLENLKRWHWMIIGLLFGAMFGGTLVFWRDVSDNVERSYDRNQFAEYIDRGMEVQKLVLHPEIDGQEWISGEWYKLEGGRQMGARLRPQRAGSTQPAQVRPGAWVKFVLLAADTSSKRPIYLKPVTAKEYMDNLANEYPQAKPQLAYKFAWWEVPKYTVAMYAAGGFVLVGVIWPTIINVLSGAGFGRGKQEVDEYDLSRFKGVVEPEVLAAAMPKDDQALLDLNAKMEANVADMMVTSNLSDIDRENEEEEQAIKQLQMQKMDAVETDAEKADREAREYKGEFYPVAKPTVHKDTKH